jgi:hypothetical protein
MGLDPEFEKQDPKKFTVCGEKEMGWVLALEPSDLVDLLLNLQGLEVVELRLVRLIAPREGKSSSSTTPSHFSLLNKNVAHAG